jgi:hypothetical protein
MLIDQCSYDFATLSHVVLPRDMKSLRKALKSARPGKEFIRRGAGVRTIARDLGKDRDFRGCYVFLT